MPRAKIGGESAGEAYKVLTHFLKDDNVTSLGSSEVWIETLARFYICLNMAPNESMKMKETSSSGDTNIFGFELMDILLSESPFRFTERKVRRESRGWRDVGYVLFCSEPGNAIIPGTGGNELCRTWSRLGCKIQHLVLKSPHLSLTPQTLLTLHVYRHYTSINTVCLLTHYGYVFKPETSHLR